MAAFFKRIIEFFKNLFKPKPSKALWNTIKQPWNVINQKWEKWS